jgi:hypothetical protein
MGDEGKPLRDFFGDDLIKNILKVHEEDISNLKMISFEN